MYQTNLKYSTETPPKYPQSSTGKERDSETGFSYFGARYYDSDLMTGWLSVDPMSDKYPSLSPYAYCGWNPVRLVDPDGKEIDPSCLDDWNAKKTEIQNRKNELIAERTWLSNKTSFWGKITRKQNINELDERITSLEETLSTMNNLEGDCSTTYTLCHIQGDGKVELITEGNKKGMISIKFSNISSFVHEVTHAGQYYNNEVGFFLPNGSIAAYDIYDEVNAYKAALAFEPYAYDKKRQSMSQVTKDWVLFRNEKYAGCGTSSVNIFSSAAQIKESGIDNLGGYPTYLDIPSNKLMYRH